MKHTIAVLSAVCALMFLCGVAAAKSVTVYVSMDAVHAHTGERGTFYVLDVSIPEEVSGNKLDSVVLEFAVDASAHTEGDSVVTPVVGVYPVNSEFVANRGDGPVGTVEAPDFTGIVPSSRPVALGEHHVLRMEITDIVKGWIASPENNHGLVIGTLTGPDVGTISLNDTLPAASAPIRVTYLYRSE
jgi:hypothetical protein